MIFEMHITDKEMFNSIYSGNKKFDARLFDYKRRIIFPGDCVLYRAREIVDEEGMMVTVPVVIDSVHIYSTFEEMFKDIPLQRFGFKPDVTQSEAVEFMENYYKNEGDDWRGYCVVAYWFCRIADNLEMLEKKFKEQNSIGIHRNVIDLR